MLHGLLTPVLRSALSPRKCLLGLASQVQKQTRIGRHLGHTIGFSPFVLTHSGLELAVIHHKTVLGESIADTPIPNRSFYPYYLFFGFAEKHRKWTTGPAAVEFCPL